MMKRCAVAFALLAGAVSAASAQTPGDYYRIQAACRADVAAFCDDVKPGGGRLLACLQTKGDKVSNACRAVLPRAAELVDQARADGRLPK
jgi:hypothetical protein